MYARYILNKRKIIAIIYDLEKDRKNFDRKNT